MSVSRGLVTGLGLPKAPHIIRPTFCTVFALFFKSLKSSLFKSFGKKSTIHSTCLETGCKHVLFIWLYRITNFGHSLDSTELWKKTVSVRHQNLLTHREHSFKSLHTGTQSPIPKTSFLENFDNSMESFLAAL